MGIIMSYTKILTETPFLLLYLGVYYFIMGCTWLKTIDWYDLIYYLELNFMKADVAI